jgi:hypothetical protein
MVARYANRPVIDNGNIGLLGSVIDPGRNFPGHIRLGIIEANFQQDTFFKTGQIVEGGVVVQADTAASIFLIIKGVIADDVRDTSNLNGIRKPIVELLSGFDMLRSLGLIRR